MEGPPAIRRADSGELLAHFCAEQLAEPCSTTSLADLFVWRDVCDALACFWRGDGHRARPVERPENNGDSDRKGSREILDCRVLNDRNSPGASLLSGLDHCELPGFGNAVVPIGCNFTLEKPGLQSKRNATFPVGLERRRAAGNVLELDSRNAYSRALTRLSFLSRGPTRQRPLRRKASLRQAGRCTLGSRAERWWPRGSDPSLAPIRVWSDCAREFRRKSGSRAAALHKKLAIATCVDQAFWAWRRRNVGTSRSSAA